MDFILLKNFFADYSLPMVIIAIIVGVGCFFADKFLKNKIPQFVLTVAPFVLSIILYFAYDMIFVSKAFVFSSDALIAGLLCGSLSSIVKSAVLRISKGKPLPVSATVLLIENILSGYVTDAYATAVSLENLVNEEKALEEQCDNIACIIKENANKTIEEDELTVLTTLIIKAVKTLKGKK